jgi:acid phosphatase
LEQGRVRAAIAGVALVVGHVLVPVAAGAEPLPRPDHVVLVVMENHSYSDIVGNSAAPYITSLAQHGVDFLDAHAVTHPSQPNYFALFSGSTQGVTSNSCPHSFMAPSLGGQLFAAGLSFAGYAEGLPADGFLGCKAGRYERKHAPWVSFADVPITAHRSLASFPADYAALPTVAFVTPDMCNDMHDCGVATGDSWLQRTFDPYVQWAKSNNSLFILTWDEDDRSPGNHIPTIFAGAMLTPGAAAAPVTHYDVLRTLQDMYGLPYLGESAVAAPIRAVWAQPAQPPAPAPAGGPAHAPASAITHTRPAASRPAAPAPRCRVPRVQGLSPPSARRALRRAGCRPGGAARVRSRVAAGRVAGSRPRAGTSAPAGTRVALLVSRGPAARLRRAR